MTRNSISIVTATFIALTFSIGVCAVGIRNLSPLTQTFHCTNAIGGPTPATVDLAITSIAGNRSLVVLKLTNPIFPNGVTGHFVGQHDLLRGAKGEIASIDSTIYLDSNDGPTILTIYVQGDHRNNQIETGFGLHLICSATKRQSTRSIQLEGQPITFISSGTAAGPDGGTKQAAEGTAIAKAEKTCGGHVQRTTPFYCVGRQNIVTVTTCWANFECQGKETRGRALRSDVAPTSVNSSTYNF